MVVVSAWNEISRAFSSWIFVLGVYPGFALWLVWGAPLVFVVDDSVLFVGTNACS
jgi:hypothetical protein